MRRTLSLTVLSLSLTASAALAQSYKISAVYTANTTPTASQGVLTLNPNATQCNQTWYVPDILQYPNGDLGYIAQGGHDSDPSCGMNLPIDSFFSAERNMTNGVWTTPPSGACPTVRAEYNRCRYNPATGDHGPIGGPSTVRIADASSPTGYKYFMAYNGGNSDYVTDGKIYWAVSNDAVTWTHYSTNPPAGQIITPIIYPYYHDCEGSAQYPDGVQNVVLLFEPTDTAGGTNPNGTFYIFFNYANHAAFYGGLAFRFGYNPQHPFGFGTNAQIFEQGQWRPHTGKLVWQYDVAAGRPVVGSDPVLQPFSSISTLNNGIGDIKKNPDTGQYLHIYPNGGESMTQVSSSLATDSWSNPVQVDSGVLKARYSDYYPSGNLQYEGGLWYGSLGTRRGWWYFVPVNHLGCTGVFQGLGIVTTALDPL